RLVPAVAGAMGGFCLGSSLGMVGKIGGAFIGFEVGKLIGTFLSHTIGGIFYDQYPAQPPLWQRLLGYGHGYAYQPVSSTDLGGLRDRWLNAVNDYQAALK